MSEELKPVRCGCGGEPVVGHIEKTNYVSKDRWYIGCPKCDICTGLYDSEAEVVTAWNRAMSGSVQECAKNARCNDDLISRKDVEKALDGWLNQDIYYHPDAENRDIPFEEIKYMVRTIPSAEPERNIIRCADCKWWDRLEEGHPYGYCRACRSGTHTDRWDISIYRQNRFDFYCADAEPKEEDEDE